MTVKKLIEKVSSRFKLALVFILSSQNDFSEKNNIHLYGCFMVEPRLVRALIWHLGIQYAIQYF